MVHIEMTVYTVKSIPISPYYNMLQRMYNVRFSRVRETTIALEEQ